MNTKIANRFVFDPACLELAEHFLPSTASVGLKYELAQAIQDCVESFCEDAAKCESTSPVKP